MNRVLTITSAHDKYPSVSYNSLLTITEIKGNELIDDAVVDEKDITELNDSLWNLDPLQKWRARKVSVCEENSGHLISRRHRSLKAMHVNALIEEKHVGCGENASCDELLTAIIKKRGKESDECDYIVPASLGGKMVDFNLYPNNRSLHNGFKSNYVASRIIEASMKMWLKKINKQYSPQIRLKVYLSYKDKETPDKPSSIDYVITFAVDIERVKEAKDETTVILCDNIVNLTKTLIETRNRHIGIIAERLYLTTGKKWKSTADDFIQELNGLFSEMPPLEEESSRGASYLDFVPFVGSVKTITDGIEDFKDEDPLSGAVNVVVGSACLVLDCFTFGFGTGAVSAIAKNTVKEAVKQTLKTTATYCVTSTLRRSFE